MTYPPDRARRLRRFARILAPVACLVLLASGGPQVLAADTSAVPASGPPVIAAAGDIACDPRSPLFREGLGSGSYCRAAATLEVIESIDPTAVLPLGDEQYSNGTLWKFRHSYALSWGTLLDLTRPVPGNHEYESSSRAAGYFTYFGSAAGSAGEGWYSYDLGAWHLIALNSNCYRVGCRVGSAQREWLKADLKASSAECTLAYWHHPRFSSGPHGDDNSVLPFWRLLYRHGADVVLNGHDHSYERFLRQRPDGSLDPAMGIQEFVVGTGGAMHYEIDRAEPHSASHNDSAFGVLRMSLRPTSYVWRFVPALDATFEDSGVKSCHGAPA